MPAPISRGCSLGIPDNEDGGTPELQMGNTSNKELGSNPADFPASEINLNPEQFDRNKKSGLFVLMPGDRFQPAAHMHFMTNILDVCSHRCYTNLKIFTNLFVDKALGQ